jgi:hypothetical protein
MNAVLRSLTRTCCPVCGFAEVRTDEAIDREIVFLAECPHCEHRWTSRAPIPPGRPLVRAGRTAHVREAASAA